MVKKLLLTILLFCPLFGQAQATTGYHRVGQVLARAPQGGVQANVVPNAQITVTSTATGLAATIYSDPLLSSQITPPLVTSDSSGNYSYYLPLNYCVTETITSPSQGTQTIKNICINGGGRGSGNCSGTLTAGYYPIVTGGPCTLGNGTISFASNALIINANANGSTIFEVNQGSENFFQLATGSASWQEATGPINIYAPYGMTLQGEDGAQPGTLNLLDGATPPALVPGAVQITAPLTVSAYRMKVPPLQGTGAICNDGAGNLSFGTCGAPASPSGSAQFNDNGSFGGTATVIDVLPYTASGAGATDLAAAFAAAATVCEATASCNTITGVSLPCATGSYNWTRLTLTQPINIVGTKNCTYLQQSGFVGPGIDIERSTGPHGPMTVSDFNFEPQPNNDWIDDRADDQSITLLTVKNSVSNAYGNGECSAGLGYGIDADAGGPSTQNLPLILDTVTLGASYYATKTQLSYYDRWDNVRILGCNGQLGTVQGDGRSIYADVSHNGWVGGGTYIAAPNWISSANWQSGFYMQLPTRMTKYLYQAQNTGVSGTSMPTDCGTLNCTTTDNTITWKAVALLPHIWQPATVYPAGACSLNVDTAVANLGIFCTTLGGISGTTVPAWATTGSVTDGSITDWAYISTYSSTSGATETFSCHQCNFEDSPSGTSVVLFGSGDPLILDDGSIVSNYGGDGILIGGGAYLSMSDSNVSNNRSENTSGIEGMYSSQGFVLKNNNFAGSGGVGNAIYMPWGCAVGSLSIGNKFSSWGTDISQVSPACVYEFGDYDGSVGFINFISGLQTKIIASTTSGAGINIAPGTAPTSPVNGDLWSTSAGFFARVNGATVPFFGGVTSINSTQGAFNFTFSVGAGSCTGTNCNFTGSGVGGGSVSDFIANSASWPSWITPSVATSTTTPTLSVTATTGETANEFLATPNGLTGAVGLRAIVNADVPTTLTGITIDGVTPTTMSYVDATSSIQTQFNSRTGTLSSIAWSLPAFMSSSPSTLTANGTQTFSFNNITANYGLFGPTTGSAATPTFRAMVNADLPTTMTGITIDGVTPTKMGYVDATSSIQTQLNGKQASGTYVTAVTGTAPVVSSGGTTPAISMHVADASDNGYLNSTDWSTFNGKAAANATMNINGTSCALAGNCSLTVPITIVTSATVTLGGTYNLGVAYNENSSASQSVVATLPAPAAGKLFCIKNFYNGSTADTGTLELLVANTGTQYIVLNGVISSSGYVISSGASGDYGCVTGVDGTHWDFSPSAGSWTLH